MHLSAFRAFITLAFLTTSLFLLGPLSTARAGSDEVFVYKMKNRVAIELVPAVSAVLSPGGRVSVDSRTNSLIIVDSPENVAQAKTLLASQDVRQSNIEITVETLTEQDLNALHLEVDWSYRSDDWQIGTVPVGLPGSGFSALGTAGAERARDSRRTVQMVTVMNGGSAEIATGRQVPFTDVIHHYASGYGYVTASTRWVAVDTGFSVHARTIGEDRIFLELTPWMRNLSKHGQSISFTEASTQIEVKDGQSMILGSSSRKSNQALVEILRGGARRKVDRKIFLMVTARKR